jgi:hypothetical protein
MKITIENLEVMFDAERQHDEARFAELFAQYQGSHDDKRQRSAEAEARGQRERSVSNARGGW